MTDTAPDRCLHCGSRSLDVDRIVEHGCGHVDSFDAFSEACPKCGRETTAEDLSAVQTVDRCRDCGVRAPVLATGSIGPLPAVSVPTLPSPDEQLNWVPARFLPDSRRSRQLFSTLLVLVVLAAGIAGAVSVTPMLQESQGDPETVETSWEEYDSIVVFRNDDIQPWYNPEAMRAVDQVFIDEEVPVTLAIIPQTGGEAPLTDDPDLCTYLRSLETDHPDQFEMALHGYTHESETDFYGGSEFGGLSESEQRERLGEGAAILDECVESPSSTFVPPMNTYDETTVEVSAAANYTTVSGGQWFTDQYYDEPNGTVFEDSGVIHVPETQSMEDWSAYAADEYAEDGDTDDSDNGSDSNDNDSDSGDEDEAETEDAHEDVPFHDLETLTDSFDDSHADGDVHVVMLHYQYFTTEERLELLESLIQHMKGEDDVAFMTVEQLSAGLETGAIEQTDDGWRVHEPIAEVTR